MVVILEEKYASSKNNGGKNVETILSALWKKMIVAVAESA